jgi:hypothetical protein
MSLKSADLNGIDIGKKELEILKGNKSLQTCTLLGFYAACSGNS